MVAAAQKMKLLGWDLLDFYDNAYHIRTWAVKMTEPKIKLDAVIPEDGENLRGLSLDIFCKNLIFECLLL